MYVLLVDRESDRVMNERLVVAPLMAAGMKFADGSEITLPDADEARRLFDERLVEPFGKRERDEQFRKSVLREVAAL